MPKIMQFSFRVHVLVSGPADLAFIHSSGLPASQPASVERWTCHGMDHRCIDEYCVGVDPRSRYHLLNKPGNRKFFPPRGKPPPSLSLRLSAAGTKDRIEGSVLSRQRQTCLAKWGWGTKPNRESMGLGNQTASKQPLCSSIMGCSRETGKSCCCFFLPVGRDLRGAGRASL